MLLHLGLVSWKLPQMPGPITYWYGKLSQYLLGSIKIGGCYQSLTHMYFMLVRERRRKTWNKFNSAESRLSLRLWCFLKNTPKCIFEVIIVSKESNWERLAFCLVTLFASDDQLPFVAQFEWLSLFAAYHCVSLQFLFKFLSEPLYSCSREPRSFSDFTVSHIG